MIYPQIPDNESVRLKALQAYEILDSEEEIAFDDITAIAAEICQTPIALISFIDEKRQWFKSKHGLAESETPREIAFCAHAINYPNEILEVPDAELDERFHDNPLVTNDANVRFYTGAPMVNNEGFALGTLCVIDHKPNKLSESQKKALSALANQVIAQLELKKRNNELKTAKQKLVASNEELKKFAYIVSHDIKSPIKGIISLSEIVSKYIDNVPEEAMNYIQQIQTKATKLDDLVHAILEFYTVSEKASKKENFNLNKLTEKVLKLVHIPAEIQVSIIGNSENVFASKTAIQMILLNLLTNAIKYNDKAEGKIVVHIEKQRAGTVVCSIQDNGRGIAESLQSKIFMPFTTLGETDRFGKKGHGLGLSAVAQLLEKNNGSIRLESKIGKGSTFIFTLPQS